MCLRSTTALLGGLALPYVNDNSFLTVALTDLFQMTWVFVILGDLYDIKRGEWHTDTHSLISAQELWFAVFMTIL
jgi:predicted membrane protein